MMMSQEKNTAFAKNVEAEGLKLATTLCERADDDDAQWKRFQGFTYQEFEIDAATVKCCG
ncbi:hypothetical protein SAMD00023353_0401320 [Rosellinia necatrix]|uniref:Uncharacterized protein n=1 Tax=Rosellinia necatrix TaxID=77044 RepID=A0A1S8A5F9_ROSNE|nr:hypothetical protein SAMD00023353_0401320 [Rosellinia necatrix]